MDGAELARFPDWLHEQGIEGPRRIVRTTPSTILVSKFPEGFAAHLHEAIDRLDVLFDDASVARDVAALAEVEPAVQRVQTWHRAVLAILESAVDGGAVTPKERAEVEAGVDSVAALLDTALWSGPTWEDRDWRPAPGEVSAFDDALVRMDEADGLFARYYGTYEGVPVENHCPGVSVARRLLRQAWSICAGTTP
jgi:hypothetical protein